MTRMYHCNICDAVSIESTTMIYFSDLTTIDLCSCCETKLKEWIEKQKGEACNRKEPDCPKGYPVGMFGHQVPKAEWDT